MLANTSSGCEPIYNVAFFKNVSPDIQGDEMLVEFDSFFLRVLKVNDGVDVEEVKEEALSQMQNNEYQGVHGLESVPDVIADLFITAGELSAKKHAAVLCACQEGVDSGISKTCNFPNHATVDEMDEVYRYIYEKGGKSVTVYRDGSRSKQVITTRADNQEAEESEEEVQPVRPREVPDKTHGTRYRIKTGYGKLYVHVNEDEHGPIEVFATIGKSGGFTEQFCEALARMISLSLRWGVPPSRIIRQLEGIRSPQSGWEKGHQVQSVPDGIALALKKHTGQDTLESVREQMELEEAVEEAQWAEKKTDGGVQTIIANGENPECDRCGSMLTIQEGCEKCPSCGWSKC